MALNNLNNPFSPQPCTPVVGADGEGGVYQSSPQFVTPPEDPNRSRHSSAGSDNCGVRSAPLSPCVGGHTNTPQGLPNQGGGGSAQPNTGPNTQRQRHQSAGGLPNATIHYRPQAWGQSNGDQALQGEFILNSEVSSLLPEGGSERQFYSQSQPPTPHTTDYTLLQGHNHTPSGQQQSHHSSYNNTPIPQEFGEFGVEGDDLGMAPIQQKLEQPNQKRKDNNDDLDLALDALRDCDTDFSKFVQEVGGSNNGQ